MNADKKAWQRQVRQFGLEPIIWGCTWGLVCLLRGGASMMVETLNIYQRINETAKGLIISSRIKSIHWRWIVQCGDA